MYALSIRKPWCFFIFHHAPWRKDIENRSWPDTRELVGKDFWVHASRTMTAKEFDEACKFAAAAGATMFPDPLKLKRGGLVGTVKLTRVVRVSASRWFTGRYGFVLEEPFPMPFEPCAGDRGFFKPQLL